MDSAFVEQFHSKAELFLQYRVQVNAGLPIEVNKLVEFLQVPLFDDDFYRLIVRFCFNLLFLLLIVGVCYNSKQKNKSFTFTFLMMNVMVFFICFTLKKLDLGLGMALGLFAIFAIIRYRTDAIKVKEMTYLFIVIGIAVINALSNEKTSYAELLFSNVVIVGCTYFLEMMFSLPQKMTKKNIVYDKIGLLVPDRREELLHDLRERTGLDIQRVRIAKLDFERGIALIVVQCPKVN